MTIAIMVNICFVISTCFTVVLLILYVINRDSIISLTIRTPFSDWGSIQTLFKSSHIISWDELLNVIWCPVTNVTYSTQCQCISNYYHTIYVPDMSMNRTLNPFNKSLDSLSTLGEKHATGILNNCLRERPSWRKDNCGKFCRVHIITPVLLMTLYMSLFYSRICLLHKGEYKYFERFHYIFSFTPIILALLIIAFHLYLETTGGILSSLSVISVLVEIYSAKLPVEEDHEKTTHLIHFPSIKSWKDITFPQIQHVKKEPQLTKIASQTFWSHHRYFCSSLAVWVGVTNQSRDVYLIIAYGMQGFFIGLLSYMMYLVKNGVPCKHDSSICMHLWIGICVVTGSFLLLIQQHWYTLSPMHSTMFSAIGLLMSCFQCVLQSPRYNLSIEIQISVTLLMLTCFFGVVIRDIQP